MDALLGYNAEASLFDNGIDRSGEITGGRIGLQNGKSAL
jgi:hypothetical protein